MTRHDVDEAFEWLIVILGILSAILSQYPEYFYTTTPGTSAASLKAAMAIIPPMVVIIVIWLVGKLSEREAVQALAKVMAWMITLSITYANLVSYAQGITWAASGVTPTNLATGVGVLGFFLFGPAITYFVVVPKYRRVYPTLPFLRGKARLLILFAVTNMLLLALMLLYTSAG